eukprot:3239182-Rhodomonas_salina.1
MRGCYQGGCKGAGRRRLRAISTVAHSQSTSKSLTPHHFFERKLTSNAQLTCNVVRSNRTSSEDRLFTHTGYGQPTTGPRAGADQSVLRLSQIFARDAAQAGTRSLRTALPIRRLPRVKSHPRVKKMHLHREGGRGVEEGGLSG